MCCVKLCIHVPVVTHSELHMTREQWVWSEAENIYISLLSIVAIVKCLWLILR